MEPLAQADLDRLRRLLLAKGAEVNQRLTRLLAGKPVELEALMVGDPGETPAERLQAFMRVIDARLAAIRAGTFGRCAQCQQPLELARLEAMPWADTCAACAGGGL